MNVNEIEGYDKLSKARQGLLAMVLDNFDKGIIWKQGWKTTGSPESATSGKKYRGSNYLYLALVAMAEGYSDNRWATYKQMEERGWSFKKDEEGKSIAKGKGIPVEFFELRDRETKKPFDRHVLDGMTIDEREEYMRDNVYPIKKSYVVFNGDLIDGIPQKEKPQIDINDKIEKAENIITYWDKNEAKIIYGGGQAFYKPTDDTIHLPDRESFKSMQEFYSTAFHEIGHSTGHIGRLNRDLSNEFGSSKYALEELRAEFASLFLEQDLNIEPSETHIQNNAAYIEAWKKEITEDPNALFTAIADADKISRYVSSKGNEKQREVEYFSIVQDENRYGETVYKLHMCSAFGQTAVAINYGFADRDALMKEFEKMQQLPYWKGKEFQGVSYDRLTEISRERAMKEDVQQEQSSEYIKPSEIASETKAVAVAKTMPAVDMSERGVESLQKMSDREVVERATKAKNGEKFSALYNGLPLYRVEEKDARSLMTRIAMCCNGDKSQLMRVFKSSGLFDDTKPNSYYEKIADSSLDFVSRFRNKGSNESTNVGANKGKFGFNAKR